MADKPIMKYEVRPQLDRINNVTIYVPSIVDRNAAKSLATVIENAIDRGLIVGVKPSAAGGIATGLCEQLFKEFKDGNSVNFDGYFYGRIYLDGTVGSDGRLTSANSINIRLVKGTKFSLAMNDFSFTNVADDKCAKLDYVVSSAGVRGEIKKNGAIYIDGSGFGSTTAGVTVKFSCEDEDDIECTPTSVGPNRVTVAFPAALAELEAGTEITVTVIKTVDGTDYASNAKTATLVSAE